ncbi:hypothetical protein GPECTOR_67g303 [Gonium pectorale]|uniref:DUS-like FMN-binding domain-containing protein n=1 Tax=Gonium pectorale TaxID=33097 RepID=A0A150G3V8_GONPE|nr:hypothetical protein GPECTOR_67g303 [Gonium pectorale]|eukprot:KXZ44463.1 hypothetical protein GPECTOR_67g303 [Gonium pectorale]
MACDEAALAQPGVAPAVGTATDAPSASDNPAAARPLLSVAPMMDWTDVHFRQLARLLSRRTWLWTEMVVDKTIIHTQNLDKHLWFPPEQRPLVLQLGGSDPATLAAAAAKAAEYGYDEINLNCGCPSDRVAGAGCFGAALMLQPELVGDCMAAMAAATAGLGPGGRPLPLSVKCRLGVDEEDSYAQLQHFVRVVSERSPVSHFIVHARKAYLDGLSPHQNRTVPPLRHQWAWALAKDFPHLQFSLNGGLLSAHDARAAILTPHPEVPYRRPTMPPDEPAAAAAAVCAAPSSSPSSSSAPSTSAAADNLGGIEGVMIGRGAYNDPWGCLADADRAVFGEGANAAPSRRWVIARYREYAEPMVGRWHVKADGHADPSVRTLMRPLLNLFHGEPGCKRWKAAVDDVLKAGPHTFGEVLDRTLHLVPDHVLDAPPRTPELGALAAWPLDPELPGPASRAGHYQGPPGSPAPRPEKKKSKSKKKADKKAKAAAVKAEAGAGGEVAGGAAGEVEESGGEASGEEEEEEGAVGTRSGEGEEGERPVACCAEAREAAAQAAAVAAAAEASDGDASEQDGRAECCENGMDTKAATSGAVVAEAASGQPHSAVVAAAATAVPDGGGRGGAASSAAGSGAQERRRRRGCVVS